MAYQVKVYVVQRYSPDGKVPREVVAVKLTYADAHAIAKKYAPARVICAVADKSDRPNVSGSIL